jgi:hypothetical protein
MPNVLNAALCLPLQVVSGYKGTADIRIAAESSEVAGFCTGWESFKSTWRSSLDSRGDRGHPRARTSAKKNFRTRAGTEKLNQRDRN